MERKIGLLGRNGQHGHFILLRPEELYRACARPVTDEDEIEFGYGADDGAKAASIHMDLKVNVVQLKNCVGFPAGVHPDTFIVFDGALRLHCLFRYHHRRGTFFKVLCHLIEVIDCQGKSFASICVEIRGKVLGNCLMQQHKADKRKVFLYHCFEYLKLHYDAELKSDVRVGRVRTGDVKKPRAILTFMYRNILKYAGYNEDQIPLPRTLDRMISFVMAIDPVALKNLTCAPVSDARFNFIFDAAWCSAALSESDADLALKWVSIGMSMQSRDYKPLFSAIAAKFPRPDQLSLIATYKANLTAWIAPPEAVISPVGCAADGSGGSEEEDEEILECEVRPFALSLF